jgi:toxin FitB
MKYLLDTCILSEYNAKRPNETVLQWLDGLNDQFLYISVITIGEISKGIQRLPESKRKLNLQSWLNDELIEAYRANILLLDTGVMLTWAALTSTLELKGQQMPYMDSLIAATALHENCTLVTRNEKDFQYSDVSIINPWNL